MEERLTCQNCGEELKKHWKTCPVRGTAVEAQTGDSGNEDEEDSPADEYMEKAFEYLEAENYENALKCANEAIRLDPSNDYCHWAQGQAYLGMERYDEAVDAFGAAIRLDLSDAGNHADQGQAYFEKGWYNGAVDAFNAAIRLSSGEGVAHYWQGRAYCEKEMPDEPSIHSGPQ